jgi:hypothetical protein
LLPKCSPIIHHNTSYWFTNNSIGHPIGSFEYVFDCKILGRRISVGKSHNCVDEEAIYNPQVAHINLQSIQGSKKRIMRVEVKQQINSKIRVWGSPLPLSKKPCPCSFARFRSTRNPCYHSLCWPEPFLKLQCCRHVPACTPSRNLPANCRQ